MLFFNALTVLALCYPICFHIGGPVTFRSTHRFSYYVSTTHGKAAKIPDYLHYLLLIYDDTVCRFQDMLQLWHQIMYGCRVMLACNILGNEVHRTRTIKRYTSDYVFKRVRAQFLDELWAGKII